MKKILLATTILGMSAGVAAADISWSASAAAGMATAESGVHKSGALDSNGEWVAYSSMKIAVKGSAETDSGLTFSGVMDLTSGLKFNIAGDLGDGFENKSSNKFGIPTIAIGGAFGTVSVSLNNFDMYDDTNDSADVKYEGTFGAFSVGVIADVSNMNSDIITDDQYSVKLGYSADAIAVSLDTDTYGLTNASASYTMGAITGTLSTSDDNGYSVTKLKLAYSANGISASIKAGDDESYDVTLGYSANGMTIDLEADEADYTKVTGSYDLGGGLAIVAGADSDESAYVGATMKF